MSEALPNVPEEGPVAEEAASSGHGTEISLANSPPSSSPTKATRHSPFDQASRPHAADGPHTPGLLRLKIKASPDGVETTDDEVMACSTMRHKLRPMDSPFVKDCYFGGGFVSDDDRVSLQSLLFASPCSRGALFPHGGGGGGIPVVPNLLARTLSTPRSSVDTNQDSYFEATPRFALRAGPRATIYYHPQMTRIAIVSCGGICPGENDVIRAIVLKALDYGVPDTNIWGIRMGFSGFGSKTHKPIVLTRQSVEDIHLEGGTILGTCESCECDVMAVVKRLDLWAVDQLFVIGGQHELSAAGVIQKMCDQCDVQCAVIAIPKSIDNDFLILDKCFGFETCVEEAQKALLAAKMEASSAYRGIGLVKLMGRRSGFIAVKAALASGLVDVVLIPEIRFDLDRVLSYVERMLELRGHVVMCMGEGAGQERFPQCVYKPGQVNDCQETDVGHWMKQKIKMRLKDIDCKFIDPSYLIRSIPATSDDRVYCKMLAHGAVHAAFAGYTGVAVGQVNTHVVYLPLHILAQAPRQMDPQGELWNRMCAANGQPPFS